MKFFDRLWLAVAVFHTCGGTGDNGTYYSSLSRHGVPYVTLFIGTGREAWRVTQMAIEAGLTK